MERVWNRKRHTLIICIVLVLMVGCGSSKQVNGNSEGKTTAEEPLFNRSNLSLLAQIRQKKGIVIKNGVPSLQKADVSLGSAAYEPLYILNGQVMGNSFSSVNEIVEGPMVKKIEVLSGADASFYGTQGSSGVIKITTY
ncbi:MAG: hypothetical protein AB3N16_13940 [Flavobacteriaceae bacterium]